MKQPERGLYKIDWTRINGGAPLHYEPSNSVAPLLLVATLIEDYEMSFPFMLEKFSVWFSLIPTRKGESRCCVAEENGTGSVSMSLEIP